MMDETTNALDPNMRDELLEQVQRTRGRGQAVLFSSHVLSEVEQICDRVGILQRGRLVHLQPMDQLRQARLVRVRLETAPRELPDLPGVTALELVLDRLTLEQRGDIGPLLRWLASQPVRDLQIQPLGLANIYHRYHGNEA